MNAVIANHGRVIPLANIEPGQLFKPVSDNTHVYALLTHDELTVKDQAYVWTVVIASIPGVGSKPVGSIVQLAKFVSCNVLQLESSAVYRVL